MQKTALSQIIREEIIRAFVFGGAFFAIILVGGVAIASAAANGGLFGTVLNQILASGNWESPGDGTVKNADKLGGIAPTGYVKLKAGDLDCGAGKCIYGFNADGSKMCH